MGIFRSTDPTTFDDVDQVVINETAPPANINGNASNIAILVGRFQRGPSEQLMEVGSTGELRELYGVGGYSGEKELKNKKFGRLRIVRAVATDAVKATKQFLATAVPIIEFTAKYYGDYGNNIKVTIAAGTTTGKKYTVQDFNDDAVLPVEVYDNILVADIVPATFANSRLVDVTVLATSSQPDNIAATPLLTGDDGTPADTDYVPALEVLEMEGTGNIVWCDKSSATVKNALEQHVLAMPDKVAIICADNSGVDKTAAIADVAGYRSDRMVYCHPYLSTIVDGAEEIVTPSSWYASVMSQQAPNLDPANVDAAEFLAGVTGLEETLTRADYINLKDNGISAFEFDPQFGYKIKSGVLTTLVAGKTQVLRRRMADFLTNSIASFLKNYQNKVNSKAQRDLVKGAIVNFVKRLENEGILPSAQDVQEGSPYLVDTEALNTDNSIAQGFFKILYKQRIFSSMRYIVLQAEIGEGVLVTEAE